jgi:hypothetical protein
MAALHPTCEMRTAASLIDLQRSCFPKVKGTLGGRFIQKSDFSACIGVVLELGKAAKGTQEPLHALYLQHQGGTQTLIGHFLEEDIIAQWRGFSQASGLPLILADESGALHQLYPQLGRLLVGEGRTRRATRFLMARRARFAQRRVATCFGARPVIYKTCNV